MDKKECLELLDELDTIRRRTEYRPEDSADYVLRVACAIIAGKAGFTSRTDWTEELRKDTKTEYAKYYHFFPNVDTSTGKAYTGYFIKEKKEM